MAKSVLNIFTRFCRLDRDSGGNPKSNQAPKFLSADRHR